MPWNVLLPVVLRGNLVDAEAFVPGDDIGSVLLGGAVLEKKKIMLNINPWGIKINALHQKTNI